MTRTLCCVRTYRGSILGEKRAGPGPVFRPALAILGGVLVAKREQGLYSTSSTSSMSSTKQYVSVGCSVRCNLFLVSSGRQNTSRFRFPLRSRIFQSGICIQIHSTHHITCHVSVCNVQKPCTIRCLYFRETAPWSKRWRLRLRP